MNSLISTISTPTRRVLELKQTSAPIDRALHESTSQRIIEINSLDQLQQLQRCTRETLEEQFGRHGKITLRTNDPLIADHIRNLQNISGRTLSVSPKETPSTHPTLVHTVASEEDESPTWREKTPAISKTEAHMSTVLDKIDAKLAEGKHITLKMLSIRGLTGRNIVRLRQMLSSGRLTLRTKSLDEVKTEQCQPGARLQSDDMIHAQLQEAAHFIGELQRLNAEQSQRTGHAHSNDASNGPHGRNGHNGTHNGHAVPTISDDAIAEFLLAKEPLPAGIYRLKEEPHDPPSWRKMVNNGRPQQASTAQVLPDHTRHGEPSMKEESTMTPQSEQTQSVWKRAGSWLGGIAKRVRAAL